MGVTAPQFGREWTWNVGSIAAGLSMEINDGYAPALCWFDFGTSPDLSGSTRVGEYQNNQGYGGMQSHATLGDLTPSTAYYYRANVQTLVGTASGPIQGFTTAAASAPQPPDISLDRVELEIMDGGLGSLFTFTADGHGLPGTIFSQWSHNPDMSDASGFSGTWGPQSLMASPTGQGFFAYIPNGMFPAGTPVYVQAIVSTAAGTTNSAVGSPVTA
jgi:hypothetical protein